MLRPESAIRTLIPSPEQIRRVFSLRSLDMKEAQWWKKSVPGSPPFPWETMSSHSTLPNAESVNSALQEKQTSARAIRATRQKWSAHYRMEDYIIHELPKAIGAHFPKYRKINTYLYLTQSKYNKNYTLIFYQGLKECNDLSCFINTQQVHKPFFGRVHPPDHLNLLCKSD